MNIINKPEIVPVPPIIVLVVPKIIADIIADNPPPKEAESTAKIDRASIKTPSDRRTGNNIDKEPIIPKSIPVRIGLYFVFELPYFLINNE